MRPMHEKGAQMKTCLNITCAAAAAFLAGAASSSDLGQPREKWGPVEKKIIAAGWDIGSSSPEEILERADEFDKTGVDGVIFRVNFVTDAKGRQVRLTSENDVLESTNISERTLGCFVPTLKKLTSGHRAFRHSFYGCYWTPYNGHRISWTNDAAWALFASNMKVVASVARRGGAVGIRVDAEDYGNIGQYWRKPFEPPMNELAAVARGRGRQIGRAVFGEFPNVRLMSYWLLSLNESYATSEDPSRAMVGKGDLWPLFLNGIMDVMPPEAMLVDGDEHAYWYAPGSHKFEWSYVNQRMRALSLVAPENRDKYRRQVRVGFGQYLDNYTSPKRALYKLGAEGFRECLEDAVYTSDEYVWLYGEKRRWVKWPNLKFLAWMKIQPETWGESIPDFSRTLMEAKEPALRKERLLADCKRSGAPNLLDAAMKSASANWQRERDSHGTFTVLPGKGTDGSTAVAAESVASGCHVLGFSGPVKEGAEFVAEGYGRGPGLGAVSARWKKDGVWRRTPCAEAAFGKPDKDGWRRFSLRVRVPPEENGLALQIGLCQREGERSVIERVAGYMATPPKEK